MAKNNERFKKIYTQGTISLMEIWVDKETGVNYLFREDGNAAGLTVLVDKNGKPIVTPEHIDDTIGFTVE